MSDEHEGVRVILEFEYKEVILSLLTTFHNTTYRTRSVNLFKPKERKERDTWIVVDNLSFHLFVSIPRELDIKKLISYMYHYYWMSKYGTLSDIKSGECKRGHFLEEYTNVNVPYKTRAKLARIDQMNKQSIIKMYGKEALYDNIIDFVTSIECVTDNERCCHKRDNQYKITFENHLILNFFLNLFKQEVNIKISDEDDYGEERVYRPFIIKVMSYFRENDILPVRINYDSVATQTVDEYIEGQLTLVREDFRKEKRRRDGSAVKSDQDRSKLRFNKEDIYALDGDGLLQPSYYTKLNAKDQSIYKHRKIQNDGKELVNSLHLSQHNTLISYQTLYVDLSEWEECVHFLVTDINTKKIIKMAKPPPKVVIVNNAGDGEENETVTKKHKSIHYSKKIIEAPVRNNYTNKKAIKQTSIISFLA